MLTIMETLTAPKNRRILATSVLTVVLILVSTFCLIHALYVDERALMEKESLLGADSMKLSIIQELHQVDSVLLSVRMFYLETGSIEKTGRFITNLNLANSIMEDVYLVGADGRFLIPDTAHAEEASTADRDYFKYHRAVFLDRLYISTVDKGRISGQDRIRITRRIDNKDGSFGGVVIATVDPRNILYLRSVLGMGPHDVMSLVGTLDKKLRARYPSEAVTDWSKPVESLLWDSLRLADRGSFEELRLASGMNYVFQYRKLGVYPLAVVVGFSESDIGSRIGERKKWILSTAAVLVVMIMQYTVSVMLINASHAQLKTSNQSLNHLNTQLKELALYDHLTGLPSRLLFSDRVHQGIQRSERTKEHCFLLFMDLDGFKEVNDSVGHGGGDFLLKILSQRMCGVVRPSDTVSRWGGDEFVILLSGVESNEDVMRIYKRLKDAINTPVNYQGDSLQVSGSFGAAKFPEDGENLEELQASADEAMYHAKGKGKNQIVFALEIRHTPSSTYQ